MTFHRIVRPACRIGALLVAVSTSFASLATAASAQSYDQTKDWIVEQLKQYVKGEHFSNEAPFTVARDGVFWYHTVYVFSGCTLYRVRYEDNALAHSRRCGDGCVRYKLEDRYTLEIDEVPIASIVSVGSAGSAFKVTTYNDAVKHYSFTYQTEIPRSDYSYHNGMWARTDPFGLCSKMPSENQKLSGSCRLTDAPAAIGRLTRYLSNGRPTLRNSFPIQANVSLGKDDEIVQRFDRAFKHLAGESAKKGCKVVKSLF